jgi:DNA-binding CsgD family transcriptional regulator
MGIAGISSLVLSPQTDGPSANAETAQAASSASNSADTVQLTEAEQVYVLYIQGQSVAQIANALSLPVAVVDNYLNLSNSAA